jgi:hypothetical protein
MTLQLTARSECRRCLGLIWMRWRATLQRLRAQRRSVQRAISCEAAYHKLLASSLCFECTTATRGSTVW